DDNAQAHQSKVALGDDNGGAKSVVSPFLAGGDVTWNRIFQAAGGRDARPGLVLFAGLARSACGVGQTPGPVYCPADQKVDIDLPFFEGNGFRLGGDAAFLDLNFIRLLEPYERASAGLHQETDAAEAHAVGPHKTLNSEGGDRTIQANLPVAPAMDDHVRTAEPQEERSPEWAMAQNALGTTLLDKSTHTSGAEGLRLIAEAVEAYRQALTVYTREAQPHAWAMTQNNLGIGLRNQGTRTAGPEGLHLLAEAEDAYRKALTVYTREELPQLWATTQNNLGTVLREEGPRTEGEAGLRLLAEAVAVYRGALTIRTREEFPEQWAATQNNLGIALRNLGTRTGGQAGQRLLAEAVMAYRESLAVRTRNELPERWAATQLNLGIALQEQSVHAEGQEWRRLLAEATDALQAALKVISADDRSARRLQIQMNLLAAYEKLDDPRMMVTVLEQLLRSQPDNEGFYHTAQNLYHETLFDFGGAYRLTSAWLERHPDDLRAQCDLAESLFTISRFSEAEERLTALIEREQLPAHTVAALRTLEIANALALAKPDMALAKLKALAALVKVQPADFAVERNFAGTTHFIANAPALAAYRETILALFQAVESGNRDALITALEAAQGNLSG
ncbi:MAG: neutral zinc metallopeptidase, partial [Chromatiaceae bacterium]